MSGTQSEVYDDKDDLKPIFRERRSFSVACALWCCACKPKDSRQCRIPRRVFRRCFLKYDTVRIFIKDCDPFDKGLLWISVWNETKRVCLLFRTAKNNPIFFNWLQLVYNFHHWSEVVFLLLLYFLIYYIFTVIKK